MSEIEGQASTRNCVFFCGGEERLAGVNWLSAEFYLLIAVFFLCEAGVWNEFSSKA